MEEDKGKTPIRQALTQLPARNVGKMLDLARTYEQHGVHHLADLAQASPETVQKLGTGPLNGAAVDLSRLLLQKHLLSSPNMEEKPPPPKDDP